MSVNTAQILVIDDEPELLAEITASLRPTGHQLHCTSDAATAKQMATAIAPDLIIADINIGGDNGLETIEAIKRDASLSDVPVIFVSGAQLPNIVRRTHEAGGTYFVRKPFDPSVLAELVDRALWMPHLVQSQLTK